MSKIPFSRKIITAWSIESIHSKIGPSTSYSAGGPASLVYPSANLAIYLPFYLTVPTIIKSAFWHNGATVSGNVDVGIYGAKGTRIASTGSVVQSGTNSGQFTTLNAEIGPGLFFVAIAMDNTTGALFAESLGSLSHYIMSGIFQQASAFNLPSSATFALPTQDYLPKFGISTESSV